MARWADMRKQQRTRIEGQEWPKFVRLDIDHECNLIEARTFPAGREEDLALVEKVEVWWGFMRKRVFTEPEHVHPLILELVNTKKSFHLLVDGENLPK